MEIKSEHLRNITSISELFSIGSPVPKPDKNDLIKILIIFYCIK